MMTTKARVAAVRRLNTSRRVENYRRALKWIAERKCADTIGTVPVPWASLPLPIYFHMKYTEAILSNSTLL